MESRLHLPFVHFPLKKLECAGYTRNEINARFLKALNFIKTYLSTKDYSAGKAPFTLEVKNLSSEAPFTSLIPNNEIHMYKHFATGECHDNSFFFFKCLGFCLFCDSLP